MNHPEDDIFRMTGEQAPVSLDERVSRTLQHSGRERRLVPLWACVFSCLCFFAAGWILQSRSRPPADPPHAPLEVSVEASPAFAALFMKQPQPDSFFLRKKYPLEPQTP